MKDELNPYKSPKEDSAAVDAISTKELAELKKKAVYVLAAGISSMVPLFGMIIAPVGMCIGVQLLRKHPYKFPFKRLMILGIVLSSACTLFLILAVLESLHYWIIFPD
ncbi:MAG: hypothetical protein ACI9HK_003259 [Pirellulaceae bacterium]|jgi:hypothetical protein